MGARAVVAVILLVVSAAAAAEGEDGAAKDHFVAGTRLYADSKYAEALVEFKESYRISRKPELLFNIGVCQERLGQTAEAVASLELYLVELPRASDRAAVETRIRFLKTANKTPATAADEAAKKHYAAALDYFNSASYADALREFQASHRLAPYPALLFHIGQCQAQLGQRQDAVASFERYLLEDPQTKRRDSVRAAIENLKRLITPPVEKPAADRKADPVAAPLALAAPAPPAPRAPLYKRGWFWGVLTSAVVVVGAGIATGVVLGTADGTRTLPEVIVK